MENALSAILVAPQEQVGRRLEWIAEGTGDPGPQVVGPGLDVGLLRPGEAAEGGRQFNANVVEDQIPMRMVRCLIGF